MCTSMQYQYKHHDQCHIWLCPRTQLLKSPVTIDLANDSAVFPHQFSSRGLVLNVYGLYELPQIRTSLVLLVSSPSQLFHAFLHETLKCWERLGTRLAVTSIKHSSVQMAYFIQYQIKLCVRPW